MKFSEQWLRGWVNPPISTKELCDQLTMAGLEVESVEPVAAFFSGVVVGEIVDIKPHPNADRLSLCQVNVGGSNLLSIVCGAKNIYVGMKAPTAIVGAVLPGNIIIKKTKLRDELSEGMLCASQELKLTNVISDGIYELPAEAPIGVLLRDYLQLNDVIIDLSVTPNRGDCLSVQGIAREVAALTASDLKKINIFPVPVTTNNKIEVNIAATEACPHYVGCIISDLNPLAKTPLWIKERLQRSGIRSVSPAVDVTQYVMLELGQPLHAFDLEKIQKRIDIRFANNNESIILLDGQTIKLYSETLLIADAAGPLAMAGVMGGQRAAVTEKTQHIFLESAYFSPEAIAKSVQRYQLHTDASYRYERKIDLTLQKQALMRATQLLIDITGGKAGPVIEILSPSVSTKKPILLREARLQKILGVHIPSEKINNFLKRLGFEWTVVKEGWQVLTPSYRADILLEEDLIEEIARSVGYDQLPEESPRLPVSLSASSAEMSPMRAIQYQLCALGYSEIITYSFVHAALQEKITPDISGIELLNPMTQEMSVMRTSLWPGLIKTLLHNQNYQHPRVRLFETGLCFHQTAGNIHQIKKIGGLCSGSVYPEQWGSPHRAVDFFDVKGELEQLFGLSARSHTIRFEVANHPALHPGQTAVIYQGDNKVGVMGVLHPSLQRDLKIQGSVILFELESDAFKPQALIPFETLIKYPEVRRDLALVVDENISATTLSTLVKKINADLIKQVIIFDIYRGAGIEKGKKSIALALMIQHSKRTLVEKELEDLVENVIVVLKREAGAVLRI